MIGELEADGDEGIKALRNIKFIGTQTGKLKVWKTPDEISKPIKNRYVVTVDVGGISEKADYSVIVVIDRKSSSGKPEVVAQWRGHTYHDILAWKATQIAQWYGNAILVIESNTLETQFTEGNGSAYILDLIHSYYTNFYHRQPTVHKDSSEGKIGFHTNVKTKSLIIFALIKTIRHQTYIERDEAAIDEMQCYELKANGAYGAMKGKHDDILMSRAIGLAVAKELSGKERKSSDIVALKNINTKFAIKS